MNECIEKLKTCETQLELYQVMKFHRTTETKIKKIMNENNIKLNDIIINYDIQIKQAQVQFLQVKLIFIFCS